MLSKVLRPLNIPCRGSHAEEAGTHFLKYLATSLSVAFVVDDDAPMGANEELDATDFLVRTRSVSSSLFFRCGVPQSASC